MQTIFWVVSYGGGRQKFNILWLFFHYFFFERCMAWHWVGKKWASGFVADMLRVKSIAIEWTYLFFNLAKAYSLTTCFERVL